MKICFRRILVIALIILLIILSYKFTVEKYYESNDFIILRHWWDSSEGTKEVFKRVFQDQKSKYNNISLYTYDGTPPEIKDPKELYVQYSAEAWFNNPDLYDINFVPSISAPKNVIFLYGYFYLFANNIDPSKLLEKRILKSDKKFCLFSVSNGNSEPRNNFYKELSKYKHIDSCGSHLNNMNGFKCPGTNGGSKEYLDFINNYKFMICFENTSLDYYFTEKMVNAYLGGTIPIYWGCPQVSEFINTDAIFYLKPDYTEQDVVNLINEIIIIDNNEYLYKKKFEQPLFKNNKFPDLFNIDKIRENVNKILK